MGDPVRVQLRRTKGWRMPENTVSVARPGKWGNPFLVKDCGQDASIASFRNAMDGIFSPMTLEHLTKEGFERAYASLGRWVRRLGLGINRKEQAQYELRGKNLACWCPLDQPCHADVLLELANPTKDQSNG